jgi:hypothetical protein
MKCSVYIFRTNLKKRNMKLHWMIQYSIMEIRIK